jgi:hypothetical protein
VRDHISPRHRPNRALSDKKPEEFFLIAARRRNAAPGISANSLRHLANGEARQFSMKATKENFTRLSPIWVRGRLNITASENTIAVIEGVK